MLNGNGRDPAVYVALLLLVVMTAISVYDVFAVYSTGRLVTVSSVIRVWLRNFPLLGILVGLLIYHLFVCIHD